jgi:4-amino-4-deoxy-L-arabinose transferase-like glycosyltransferase
MMNDSRTIPGRIRSLGGLLLLLAAAAFVMVLHARSELLINDELLVDYTTMLPTVASELDFQSTLPMVIEPPAFDLLVRGSCELFGDSEFALRLPAVLSILILMTALYLLLLAVAGSRAAFVGTLLVMFFRLIDYGWQARPYAFLLAMVALAVLCWYRATRIETRSKLPVLGLFLSLALAVNCHYFGLFALLPFLLAEAMRTARRRKLDIAVGIALLAACASMLLTLPFLRAGMKYRGHTVFSIVTWSSILRTYEWTQNLGGTLGKVHHGFAVFTLGMVLVAAAGAAWRLIPRGETELWVLLAGILFLPVPAVAVDMFFLHSYLPRYVIYENVGLILGLGILAGPWLERMSKPVYIACAALCCVACGLHQVHLQHESQNDNRVVAALLPAPASVVAALQQDPSALIFASNEQCLFEMRYGSPLVRDRLRCIYDEAREMRYGHTNQMSLITMDLMQLRGFQVMTVDQMLAMHGQCFLVEGTISWDDWLPESLAADGVQLSPVGPGVMGNVFAISTHR